MSSDTPSKAPPTPFRGREPGAVDNAFAILEQVARSGAGVSAREIAETLGMPRATAYRILKHLVQQEYLVRSPDLSGFALGQRVRNLAGAVAPLDPTDGSWEGGASRPAEQDPRPDARERKQS